MSLEKYLGNNEVKNAKINFENLPRQQLYNIINRYEEQLKQNKNDYCSNVRKGPGKVIYVLCGADDVIVTSSNLEEFQELKKKFQRKLQNRRKWRAKIFLGHHNREGARTSKSRSRTNGSSPSPLKTETHQRPLEFPSQPHR